jgi:hypothetical protein
MFFSRLVQIKHELAIHSSSDPFRVSQAFSSAPEEAVHEPALQNSDLSVLLPKEILLRTTPCFEF